MTKTSTLIVATVLVATSFILDRILAYHLVTVAFMLATTLLAGYPVVKRALGALRYKIIGIELLVTIAVVGALIIGEYWEAAAVTYLFMLGGYLEIKTIERTRTSIKSLLSLAPDTARVIREGVEIVLDPKEVVKGDHVVIKPGERIAVDGEVLEGEAFINQASVTGESIAVEKKLGDTLYAGTIAESGYLIVRADKVGSQTTFARILELVEEAQDAKAKTQKFLEKFSTYYTPLVILFSIALYLITKEVRLALTMLVIACPGALVISAPVSIVAGIGNGAKRGILVKGGEVMERLGSIKAIAFDKTGTVTEGRPTVVSLKSYDFDLKKLAQIGASGESFSEHPLAKAIVEYSQLERRKPSSSTIITGKGVAFTLDGVEYLIGNRALFGDYGIDTSPVEADLEAEEREARTAVLIGTTSSILGFYSIADQVRSDAKELLASLKKRGIKKSIMLTGDNEHTAKAIARELGFDQVYASLLPEEKVNALKTLQKEFGRVAMVGDGVNDAPALATADIGIAIGGIGSDVAMETADVVVMSSHLKSLTHAIGLSKATVRNMKQNIYFAIAVALLLLVGVVIRKVDLSIGMFIHELSVLLVIINAVRLLRYKERVGSIAP